MHTKGSAWTVARQVAFFAPTDMKGKWHAAHQITHTAVCGGRMELGREAIRTTAGQDSTQVHPIVCRSCLRLSTTVGVSANGVER